jgi:hypothetical protein
MSCKGDNITVPTVEAPAKAKNFRREKSIPDLKNYFYLATPCGKLLVRGRSDSRDRPIAYSRQAKV